LKTMQLHGTTVTKIFRLTHKVCAHFNLYGSLDAVSALICHLCPQLQYQRFGTIGTKVVVRVPIWAPASRGG
jgi:hypothetical protein